MPHAARYHSLADATSRLFVVKKKTPAPIAGDRHPDLTGTWDYRTVTRTERPNGSPGSRG
jgi:hypothetical protein